MQLLWKEWRQQKMLFIFGCLAGICFPLFEVLYQYQSDHKLYSTSSSSDIVGSLGAFFAVLLAVATTHADIKKGVDDFWQSKPVKAWKLFAIKFLIGAVILAVTFILILSVDVITNYLFSNNFPYYAWWMFYFTYPRALMLFAITIFFCVLLRDSAKAVLLAIWVELLVYFLPLLVGWLDWFSIFEQLGNVHNLIQIHKLSALPYLPFLLICLFSSLLCFVLSVVAFERKWQWHPGQKTIAWTIGISAAFIFSIAMLQAGHNLGIVTTHNNREIVSEMRFYGEAKNRYNWTDAVIDDDKEINRRVSDQDATCINDNLMYRISTGCRIPKEFSAEISENTDPDRPKLTWETPLKHFFFLDIYSFPYADKTFHLSETIFFATEPIGRNRAQFIFGCFVRDDRLYVAYSPQSPAEGQDDPRPEDNPLLFLVVDISNPNHPKQISNNEIFRPKSWGGSIANYNEYCYINNGCQILILSIAEPDQPEIVAQINRLSNKTWFPDRQTFVTGNKLICSDGWKIAIFDLTEPLQPKLVFSERLNVSGGFDNNEYHGATAYSRGFIYVTKKSGIYVYKLSKDDEGNFSSEMVGSRKATPIERLAGRKAPERLIIANGMLVEAANSFGVLVYDVSDPTRPRRAYHGETRTYSNDIGTWNNLLYVVNYSNYLVFLDLPKTN